MDISLSSFSFSSCTSHLHSSLTSHATPVSAWCKKKKKVLLFILLTESFFFSLRCWITFTYGLVFKFRAELFFSFQLRGAKLLASYRPRTIGLRERTPVHSLFFFSRLPFSSSFFLFINFFSLCHMYHFILEYKSHEVTVGTHV